MDRTGRLQSARATGWVRSYGGKDLVRGYCKWFAVDPLCAIIELRQLRVEISQEREAHYRDVAQSKAKARLARKQADTEELEDFPDSDDTFAYIAGYTPAGFAFGVTWEEYWQSQPAMPGQGDEQACDRSRGHPESGPTPGDSGRADTSTSSQTEEN